MNVLQYYTYFTDCNSLFTTILSISTKASNVRKCRSSNFSVPSFYQPRTKLLPKAIHLYICSEKTLFLIKKSQYIFVTPFNVFLKQFLLDDPYFEIALINITDYNCNLKRATAVKKPLASGPRFCLVVEILFIYLWEQLCSEKKDFQPFSREHCTYKT